jgi:dolichyl-phosphate beta-glucosyltransferase
VPIYNEARSVARQIDKIYQFFLTENYDFEIIAVDDGSRDQTPAILRELSRRSPLVVRTHTVNRGKGAAFRTGLAAAQKKNILLTDLDLSVPLTELEKMWAKIENHPLVIGSRRAEANLIKKPQNFWRDLAGRMGNLLIRAFLGLSYSDTQCGFKLFNSSIKDFLPYLKIDRFGFDCELLYLAKKNNWPAAEVGVEWWNDPDSRVRPFDFLKTMIEVFKIQINDQLGRYPKI